VLSLISVPLAAPAPPSWQSRSLQVETSDLLWSGSLGERVSRASRAAALPLRCVRGQLRAVQRWSAGSRVAADSGWTADACFGYSRSVAGASPWAAGRLPVPGRWITTRVCLGGSADGKAWYSAWTEPRPGDSGTVKTVPPVTAAILRTFRQNSSCLVVQMAMQPPPGIVSAGKRPALQMETAPPARVHRFESCSPARRVSWAREFTSSLVKTCRRWPLTVWGETNSRSATSRLLNP
jgi:hypothetical protein